MRLKDLNNEELNNLMRDHMFKSGYFDVFEDVTWEGCLIQLTLQAVYNYNLIFTVCVEVDEEILEEDYETPQALCEALKPLIIDAIQEEFTTGDVAFRIVVSKYASLVDCDTLSDIIDDYLSLDRFSQQYENGNIEITVS